MDKCPVFCRALGGYVKHDAYVVEALAAPMSNFADRSSCTFGDPRTLFTLYEVYVLLLLNVNIEKNNDFVVSDGLACVRVFRIIANFKNFAELTEV